MSKTIRVKEDTHAALAALKREAETFDELIFRLIRERRARARAGAGLWKASNAAAKARERRSKMKRDEDSR